MRRTVLTRKSALIGVALGALTALLTASAEPLFSDHAAMAADEIAVGTELQAVDDVQVSRAEIAKGSRVSVTKVSTQRGDVQSVDIALSDGQVVKKVGIGTIRAFFRVL